MLKLSKIRLFTLIVMLALLVIGCNDSGKEITPESADVQGTARFDLDFLNDDKGRTADEPIPTAILISIKDSNNQLVYNLEKLTLVEVSGSYVSPTIELSVGSYTIEDFIVTDENDTSIYITPKSDSKFEDLVTTPLPYSFNIVPEIITSVKLDVISSALGQASDFGYTEFSFNIIGLEAGLAAYFPFNGNTKDESRNGNDGSLIGATLGIDRNDKNNQSFYFDGYNDFIEVTNSDQLQFNEDFSISVWINTTDVPDEEGNGTCIVDKYQPSTELPASLRLADNGTARFICDESIYSKTVINDGIWHLLTVTRKNSLLSLYVDGRLESQGESKTTFVNEMNLLIGAQALNKSLRNFEGFIDDVRIYKRALFAAEVRKLFEE